MKKRFNSLNDFYQDKFNSKVFKVSIDSGLSCPNKDCSKGYGGCIFCNGTPGIGKNTDEIIDQFNEIKETLHKKWKSAKYIPFFEANSNTYTSLENFKNMIEPLLEFDGVVGIAIATRCDTISDEIYDYLSELNKRTFVSIELGLQSSNEESLKFLNRGHTVEEFTECVKRLKKIGVDIVVHIIDGIPGESEEDMLETVRYINGLGVNGIKFHMLYIEEGTQLKKLYDINCYKLLTKEEYIEILAKQISILDPNIVVHRLTSGPDNKKLVAPTWLLGKFRLLNEIEKHFSDNDIVQGQKK